MSDSAVSKCACERCGVNIEFPAELEGTEVECPQCHEATALRIRNKEAEPAIDIATILNSFRGPIKKTRSGLLYQVSLLFVAAAMLLLPVVYVGLIGAAGFGVWYWAAHFHDLLSIRAGIYGRILLGIVYVTPMLAGGAVVLFMIKPLFARRVHHAQPLALNPAVEPVLYTFIDQIAKAVGAPSPSRIDLGCDLNASAAFRRGWKSMFGHDLVLTLGLPLVAGLDTRQLAGVVAHEFGHFTQGFGMRLTYVIRAVNGWFARVVYERDAWDEDLEQHAADCETWQAALVIGCIRFAIWISRAVLKLLMIIGHVIGCFALKQMEYDADSYEVKLVGSDCYEATCRRIHVLGSLLDRTYKDLRPGWNVSRELPDNFTAFLLKHDRELPEERRTRLEDTIGLEKSGLFDTHPSWGDRIRRARRAGEPGIFDLDAPATALFSKFDVPARQVTMLHYTEDLGIPAPLIRLVPATGDRAETDNATSPTPTPIEDVKPTYQGTLRLRKEGR